MYKTIFVLENELALLEELLNDLAEQGYRAVFFLHTVGRLMVIMEFKPGPGRPKVKKSNEDDEALLGA